MLKSPIPQVTNPLQYRAIGIVNAKFTPHDSEHLNRGFLIDNRGEKIETVVLGKALSLLKKHIDLKKSYFWVVYPKNKDSQKSKTHSSAASWAMANAVRGDGVHISMRSSRPDKV